MPITNHVTSLELSRRLKELAVKKSSHFNWYNEFPAGEEHWKMDSSFRYDNSGRFRTYHAYLASELDQLIAVATNGEYAFITNEELTMGYRVYEPIMESEGLELTRVGYKLEIIEGAGIMDENPADCRAKCLIYLIENHLISVEELEKKV